MNSAHRSLYIYLCAAIGILLFVTLQRSIVYIYVILRAMYPGIFDFGISADIIAVLDLFLICVALIAGGWYGVWLGLYWYDWVYGPKEIPRGFAVKLLEVFSFKNLKISNKKYKAEGFIAVAEPAISSVAKSRKVVVKKRKPLTRGIKRSSIKISV